MLKFKNPNIEFSIVYPEMDMSDYYVYDFVLTEREQRLLHDHADVLIVSSEDTIEDWVGVTGIKTIEDWEYASSNWGMDKYFEFN
jgi:hypothetical protein